LGELYDVDVRDLLEGSNSKAEMVARFRSKLQGAASAEATAIEDVLPLCKVASDIEDLLEEHDPSSRRLTLPNYVRTLPGGNAGTQGRELARMERERLDLGFGPIQDLTMILLWHRIVVVEHKLPKDVSGIFLHLGGGRSFILLSTDEPPGRRRFSLAHEYCHALVDGREGVVVSRLADSSRRERRANAFASALLLPREGILQFLSEIGKSPRDLDFTDVAKLSVRYGMSYEATLVGLDQNQLLGADHAAALHGRTKNAVAYIHTKLRHREPQYMRTTLRQWTFHRVLKALEMRIVSRRRAIAIAGELGYDESVVADNLDLLRVQEEEEE
jgi:Zn-dependent peptidase ImmA (M78 family)